MTSPQPDFWYCRPGARSWRCDPLPKAALAFHTQLPGYQPSALHEVPALAEELGVGKVFVKDESARWGLPAFKVLGASWAVARLVADAHRANTGEDIDCSLPALRAAAAAHPVELVTATDGNHGRALAYLGRLLDLPVTVFLPPGVSAAAAEAITTEGAAVRMDGDSYDESVLIAAAYADATADRVLVQDTAWLDYTQVPGWIVEGYGTIGREIDAQLGALKVPGPDAIAVPVGVGSLAQAIVTHYRSAKRRPGTGPAVLAVESDAAANLQTSLRAGTSSAVPTGQTVMAGLNCGRTSSLAWPVLSAGLDAATAVSDADSLAAVADLHRLGISAGPCGAAALAGMRTALRGPGAALRRTLLGIIASSVLVLVNTEGARADVEQPAASAERGTVDAC